MMIKKTNWDNIEIDIASAGFINNVPSPGGEHAGARGFRSGAKIYWVEHVLMKKKPKGLVLKTLDNPLID